MRTVPIYTYNVGGTNKASSIDWSSLSESILSCDSLITTLTEVSHVKKTHALVGTLTRNHETHEFAAIIERLKYDYVALIYDATVFEVVAPVTVSHQNKYIYTTLREYDTGMTCEVVAAHLWSNRNKSKRLSSLSSIRSVLDVHTETPSIIMGDFNTSPSELKTCFTRTNRLALDTNAISTTPSGRPAVDNMITRRTSTFSAIDVLYGLSGSDHFPVIASWEPCDP